MMNSVEDIFMNPLDLYRGVTIDKNQLPDSKEKFAVMLDNSMKKWKEDKARGVWLNISIEKSEFIPEAVKHGFVFHHAKSDYVLMTNWLSNEANKLPHYASHYIGVGGVVINEKNEILVIQERVKVHEHNPWKIPGGLVDAEEFLPDAAKREVFEETGISTEFVSLIALRETKSWRFGQNDIYFIALLKPTSSEIKIDPQEIGISRWMPIEEFCAQPSLIETQKRIAMLAALKLNDFKLGDQSEDLLELSSFAAEQFQQRIGKTSREQVFYCSKAADKLLQKPSL